MRQGNAILFITLLLSLSACSNYRSSVTSILADKPTPTRTNMSDEMQCMGKALEQIASNKAYIFSVRDVVDGTVKSGPYQNGPLSDAGRIQLIHALSEHTYPHLGLVTDTFPLIFKRLSNESVGLDRYGLASTSNLAHFIDKFAKIINSSRKRKELSPVRAVIPLVVNGSFTRLDKDNIYQRGRGHNFGVRPIGTDDNGDGKIERKNTGTIDFGDTKSTRGISLIVNLIDPRHNLVVGSKSFDLVAHRNNKRFRLRVAIGDGFYGFSNSTVKVEGLHSAQQTLLDAAALWVLQKSYGKPEQFNACFIKVSTPKVKKQKN